jgi:8-hydroxy-5-deazaflavin:NADPH oxidoreductase
VSATGMRGASAAFPIAMTLTIAVVGTGNIGGTLGRAFAAAGHTVVLGSRHPADGADPREVPVAEALRGADVVVLALPGSAVPAFAQEHAAALAGPLVVDAANTIGGGGPADNHDVLTGAVPGLRYARAFNTLGWENFADPRYGGTPGDLFFSSAEADRAEVETLIEAVGLRPVFVGEGQHEVVDGVLRLWFALAVGQGHGRHLAFRMLT